MTLSAVAASGTKIAVGDAFITAVLGYAVVFVGILLLMGVIVLLGKVMTSRKEDKKAETPAAPAVQEAPKPTKPAAPGTAGEIKLYDTPDKEAAMIMAIVADKMGKPLNELRFKSIKEVK